MVLNQHSSQMMVPTKHFLRVLRPTRRRGTPSAGRRSTRYISDPLIAASCAGLANRARITVSSRCHGSSHIIAVMRWCCEEKDASAYLRSNRAHVQRMRSIYSVRWGRLDKAHVGRNETAIDRIF